MRHVLIVLSLLFIGCDTPNKKPDFEFYKNELISIQTRLGDLKYCTNDKEQRDAIRIIHHFFYSKKIKDYRKFFEKNRIMNRRAMISAIVQQLCAIESKFGKKLKDMNQEFLIEYLKITLKDISEEGFIIYPGTSERPK